MSDEPDDVVADDVEGVDGPDAELRRAEEERRLRRLLIIVGIATFFGLGIMAMVGVILFAVLSQP